MIFLPPLDRKRLNSCRDASVLWGAAKGAKVVVACPGPSFHNEIGEIHRADIIVSVLRAAPLVARVCRRPQIVVAAGFQGYFVPENLPRASYIVDLRTHPAVFDALPGNIFLAVTDWDADLGVPGPRLSGASTALAALYAAAYIGSSQIRLIGWDILKSRSGMPGKILHTDGLKRFREQFPHLAVDSLKGNRNTICEKQVFAAERRTDQSINWLGRLNHLAKRQLFWTPFWGPDYKPLFQKEAGGRKLLGSQKREKIHVARILRGLGYA